MVRSGPNLFRLVSLGFIVGAVVLFFYEIVAFSRQRARLPQGLSIAGVSVGDLSQDDALERLLQTYSSPIELHYGQEIILLQPASVGFQVDTEGMMAAAELSRTGSDFWAAFWDFLWSRSGAVEEIPLRSEYSRSQLEGAMLDIANRYDQPSMPIQPIPGSPDFRPGESGRVLDIARAVELVGEALRVSRNRRVNLPVVSSPPQRPTLSTLETLLQQIVVEVAGFDGLAVIYMMDLRTGDDLHIGIMRGEDIDLKPDIAFTAASVIKIGIMTTYYRLFDEPLGDEPSRWMQQMITQSGNDPADWLMERIHVSRGPLIVTETLQEVGLESTFLAGHFRLGSDLLRIYTTPGNQRQDISTRPDVYNQTTASEIGMLLADIYDCVNGGGTLIAAFPGDLKPSECSQMLELLSQNKIGWLIEAGVPDGTRVAHKHGWTSSLFDPISDSGIVYTPGGDYVLSIFIWNDTELIFEPTNNLVADLARSVYNYFNPPTR
jgi:beta-lactamase class A